MSENNNNILEPLVDGLIDLGVMTGNLVFKSAAGLGNLLYDVGNIFYKLATGTYEYETEDSVESISTPVLERGDYEPANEVKMFKGIKYQGGLKVSLGESLEGQEVIYDLSHGHTLVAGCARWGKSNILNIIAITILKNRAANLLLCDYKRSDLKRYEGIPGVIGSCATNKDEFLKQIAWLYRQEIKRRELFDSKKCMNIDEYNSVNEDKMSYIIFMIDELPQITHDKECREALHLAMSKLSYIGLVVIAASQDVSREVIGRMRINVVQRIGLRCSDNTDSDMVIKGGNLQDIKVKGRAKLDNGDIQEFQSWYASRNIVNEYVRELRGD